MKKTSVTVRILSLALAAIMLTALAACSGKAEEGFSKDSLCVVYNGGTYKVGDKADKLLAALGTPANTISQASCHYGENGDEYTYEYFFGTGSYADRLAANAGNEDYTNLALYSGVLRVHTVPLKPGEDYICDIDCYTDKAATDKGITVGSTKEEVFKAYGENYTDQGDGFYAYYDGEALPDTPSLTFYMPDGKVEFFSVSAAINF